MVGLRQEVGVVDSEVGGALEEGEEGGGDSEVVEDRTSVTLFNFIIFCYTKTILINKTKQVLFIKRLTMVAVIIRTYGCNKYSSHYILL